MAIECFVITFILAAATFSFAHVNRIRWVIATIPFAILPLVNGVADLICKQFLKIDITLNVAIAAILAAVMISCIWIGIMSGFLNSKKLKLPYVLVGFVYNIVLAIILLNHYIGLGA